MRYVKKAVKLFEGNQEAFGKKLGVSQSIVSDWCNGRYKVPAKHLLKICELTNNEITVEQLLSDHNYKAKAEQ